MESSILGRLPPELRNTVYEEVLIQPDSVLVANDHGLARYRRPAVDKSPLHDAVRMRGVCRQMRVEVAGLYLASNHITIDPVWKDFGNSSRQGRELEAVCAQVAGWAPWLGHHNLKCRSVRIVFICMVRKSYPSPGGLPFVNPTRMDPLPSWGVIERAVHNFSNLPIILCVTIGAWVTCDRPGLNWGRLASLDFKFGDKMSSIQTFENHLAQYHQQGETNPGESGGQEVRDEAFARLLHEQVGRAIVLYGAWLSDMPQRPLIEPDRSLERCMTKRLRVAISSMSKILSTTEV